MCRSSPAIFIDITTKLALRCGVAVQRATALPLVRRGVVVAVARRGYAGACECGRMGGSVRNSNAPPQQNQPGPYSPGDKGPRIHTIVPQTWRAPRQWSSSFQVRSTRLVAIQFNPANNVTDQEVKSNCCLLPLPRIRNQWKEIHLFSGPGCPLITK